MDKYSSREREPIFDVETGMNAVIKEQEVAKDIGCITSQDKGVLSRVWSGFIGINGSIKGDRSVKVGDSTSSSVELPSTNGEALVDRRFGPEGKVCPLEKKIGVEAPKKKGCKKPPKPPRLPNSPALDAADQKLMKEISEIATMKRARIERMKKKVKDAKSTRPNSNLWALIITILFVLVIIWQGVFSRGSSSVNFHGSPESSVQTRGGLISIQFYRNASKNASQASSSASPNNVVPV